MKTYAEHYQKCRQSYLEEKDDSIYTSAYDVSLDTDLLELDDEYYEAIAEISKKTSKMFETGEGCFEDDHAIRLNDWNSIDELEWLADIVVPQIEEKVFHSYVKVEFVHPYRNKIVERDPATSWLWHYDDCPKEFLKLFIHLNEVSDKNGCIQYISDSEGKVPVLESSRINPWQRGQQVYESSRIPNNVVDDLVRSGGKINNLTGKQGSYALFTPNVMHRATVPKKGTDPRDAIVLFVRPSLKEQVNYIQGTAYSYLPERNVKQYSLN